MAFLSYTLGLSLSFDGSRVDWVLLRSKRVLADPPTHFVADLGTAETGARYDGVFELLDRRLERLAVNDEFHDEVIVLPETTAPFAGYSFVRSLQASRLARRRQPNVRVGPVELSNRAEAPEPAAWRTLIPRRNVIGALTFAFTRKAIEITRGPFAATLRADFDRLRTKRPAEEDEAGLAVALAVAAWYREREAEGRPGQIISPTYTAV